MTNNKKIVKLAVIRSDEENACPFGLPIPFGCKKVGELINRMAPINIMGEDTTEEEQQEISLANQRLLIWMLSEENGGSCPFANTILPEQHKVECGWKQPEHPSGAALRGSPFYYKHFSGIGLDGLYSYPLGYYTDNSIDRGMYYGMYSIESIAQTDPDFVKDSDEEK